MAQANVKLTVDATQAQRALKGVQAQTNSLQTAFGGLRTAIASIGVGLLAKQSISTASSFQALQLRMKVLTSEFGEFAQAQELVRKAQDKFNLSIVEATKGITDIFARLRPLGISLKEIETIFMGFNTIAVEAGLSSTEASAAFTQLAQALGSGRLQGDEFRSIAEQVPGLLVAISKETGIAEGKLKDFASDGLLTSDIVLRALNRSLDEGADKIDAIIGASPEQVFKSFSNAVLELQLSLGSKLLPAVLAVTKAATAFIDGLTAFVDSEAGTVTMVFIGIAAAIKGITVVGTLLMTQVTALKANFLAMSIASATANGSLATTTTMAFATAGGVAKATAAATAFKIALAKTGIGLVIVGLGFFVTKLLEANNAQRDFNDLINEGTAAMLNQAIAEREQKIQDLKNEILEMNPFLKNFLDTLDIISGASIFGQEIGSSKQGRQIKDLQKQIEELTAALPDAEAKDLTKEFERQQKSLTDQNEALRKSNEVSKELTEEAQIRKDHALAIDELEEKFSGQQLKELKDLQDINLDLKLKELQIKRNTEEAKKLNESFKQIGDDIATGISDALVDAIEGTRSLGEAARAIVNDLASSLLRLGINTFLSGAFGGIFSGLSGKLANGGTASAGRSYLVGERGPEIFTPRSSGTVIPNDKIGGNTNIVVNVDANSMQADGNENRGRELGVALASAIQSELIKQKRPGGLLAT